METKEVGITDIAMSIYRNITVNNFLTENNLNKYFPLSCKADITHTISLILNDQKFVGLQDLFKLYSQITYNTINYKVSEIIWQSFKHKYLIPVLELTYAKMKNYTINFYKENPLEDCFNIAFTRFMIEDSLTIFDLEKSVQKKLKKFSKNITISILDSSGVYHDHKLVELLDEIVYDPYLSISLIRVLKYIFMDKYFEDMESYNHNSIIRTVYLELSAFHVNNAISLSKYASKLGYDIDVQYKDFLNKIDGIFNYNNFHEMLTKFIETIRGTVDFIQEISRVSEYKNIDTYVNLIELYEPISTLEVKRDDLYRIYNSYKEKYVINGLKDNMLFKVITVYINKVIKEKITDYVASKRENNFVVSYNYVINQIFTITKDDINGILSDMKCEERYKENYPLLLDDTFEFVDSFTHKIESLVHIYIEFISKISNFIRDKLYTNSVNELDFCIERDLYDRINSKTSVTDIQMIQKLVKC